MNEEDPMNFNSRLAIAVLIMIGCFSACTPREKLPLGEVSKISLASLVDSQMPSKDKAEELAKAAEQLLSAEGLVEANQIADLALKEDPQNFRAQFIKKISQVYLTQKGLVVRLKPLAEKHPELLLAYNNFVEDAKKSENEAPGLNRFLNDGKPDIQTEKDFQEFIDTLSMAFEELRLFAKANLDKELIIKNNGYLFKDLASRYARACEIKTTANLEYELICPPNATRFYVTLNRADFEGIQFASTWYVIALAVMNSYDITGSVDVMQNYPLATRNQNAQKIYDDLVKKEKLGLLRSPVSLQQIKGLGQEAVVTLRWAMANQSTLCPYGSDSYRNRVGTAMPGGVCMSGMFKPFVDTLADFYSGTPVARTASRNGQSYTARVNYTAFFDNPAADLRKLGPWKYDSCGSIREVGDPTLGGILPDADANKILPLEPARCD
jgi:hypothetical protein